MKKRNVQIGEIFNRLEVVEVLQGLDIRVRCKCNPEKVFDVKRSSLFGNLTKSCGCLNKEKSSARLKKHGLSHTRLYCTFNSMVKRCYHKNNSHYCQYGGKGIRICQDWNPYLIGWEIAFLNFKLWAESHGYKEDLTIDRIDNYKGYYPNNCRFTTMEEQANNKRNTKYFTYKGVSKTASQWAKDPICKVKADIFYNRMRLGWDIEEALTTKLMANNQRK